MAHGELYIVDNGKDKSSVMKYLNVWSSVLKQLDIAVGVS